jgi:hypothetical protein
MGVFKASKVTQIASLNHLCPLKLKLPSGDIIHMAMDNPNL